MIGSAMRKKKPKSTPVHAPKCILPCLTATGPLLQKKRKSVDNCAETSYATTSDYCFQPTRNGSVKPLAGNGAASTSDGREADKPRPLERGQDPRTLRRIRTADQTDREHASKHTWPETPAKNPEATA